MLPRAKITSPLPLLTLEAQIKRGLREHFKLLGFQKDENGHLVPPTHDKHAYRELHSLQRSERLSKEADFFKAAMPALGSFFANGDEINPERIEARIQLVEPQTWESDLFRLACLTWSIPVSKGYGRRMRFLVWDESNGKLMGLIGLTDPVFNLRVRDEWIGWNSDDRRSRLVNVMDAFVLGAMPPYNKLLVGKLLACLLQSAEILSAFRAKYADSKGIISGKRKHASLMLVTTSSALGRSSIYNRLKLGGIEYLKPIGYTAGWGHFHLPEKLFSKIREYLRESDHDYSNNNRFGDGPSWRMRAIRQALSMMGLSPDLLKHGLLREVFVGTPAANAREVLAGREGEPSYAGLNTCHAITEMAKQRWIVPRSNRVQEYRLWHRGEINSLIVPPQKAVATFAAGK